MLKYQASLNACGIELVRMDATVEEALVDYFWRPKPKPTQRGPQWSYLDMTPVTQRRRAARVITRTRRSN